MPLGIETFSSLSGGNSYFKAITHPEVAPAAEKLLARLAAAKSVAVYDPFGQLEGFTACHELGGARVEGVYVQAIGDIGCTRLGAPARPVTDIGAAEAELIFVPSFDAARAAQQIAHLIPAGAEVISLDAMRLEPSRAWTIWASHHF